MSPTLAALRPALSLREHAFRLLMLAAFACAAPPLAVAPAHAAPTAKAKAAKKKGKARKPAAATPATPPVPSVALSPTAARVAAWIAAEGDNHALPYIIIDKPAARLFLYDAKGAFVGDAPVLIGIAPGDDATPGIGAKSLAEIGPAEKTTPAGRYLAKFGLAAGRQRVLWVDFATSVALHTIPTGAPKEQRTKRMLSPGIDDNRITFGCINVPKAIYGRDISPMFAKKGGYVYILPDTNPVESYFPRLHAFAAPPVAPVPAADPTATSDIPSPP